MAAATLSNITRGHTVAVKNTSAEQITQFPKNDVSMLCSSDYLAVGLLAYVAL